VGVVSMGPVYRIVVAKMFVSLLPLQGLYQGPGPMCGAMGALETGGARRCEWKKVEDGGRVWWELWAASCWEP
jgi:hypothetical protein